MTQYENKYQSNHIRYTKNECKKYMVNINCYLLINRCHDNLNFNNARLFLLIIHRYYSNE